jgi:hypothetical protein
MRSRRHSAASVAGHSTLFSQPDLNKQYLTTLNLTPAGTVGSGETISGIEGACFGATTVLRVLGWLSRQLILQNENVVVSHVVEEVWHCGLMHSWPYEGLLLRIDKNWRHGAKLAAICD